MTGSTEWNPDPGPTPTPTRGGAHAPYPVYYTRCPVPTASGIAFQRNMFGPVFEGSAYEVRNIRELGPDRQNVHFTHAIDNFFREGGGSPPVWARANGVDSVLLGITFMEERLGIFVRVDDHAETMMDLAGRRLALPVWPRLVFNFWRFAAEKGFSSALRIHAMRERDVRFVDVVEDWDPHEKRNPAQTRSPVEVRCDYRAQLRALLAGEVDAMFGKGGEAALLEREAAGRIRLLFDVGTAPSITDRVNNSTPRLLTTGRKFYEQHPEAVLRYVQSVVRAAQWGSRHRSEVGRIVSDECGIQEADLPGCFESGYADKFLPQLNPELVETVDEMKTFLRERNYIETDFAVEDWIDFEPLAEAYRRERIA